MEKNCIFLVICQEHWVHLIFSWLMLMKMELFGQPQNLGKTVNTIHREQFPFISDDGTVLYFASDGHQGMGGLDIFMSKSYDGVFAKPLNLGGTINSNLDDFAYVVDEKKNKGYLSSNRKGGITYTVLFQKRKKKKKRKRKSFCS